MSKTITVIKQRGEIINKDRLLVKLDNLLNVLANGDHILTIKKVVKQRSFPQNRLMWLWFTCIEKETGTDKNDVHDYYCSLFLQRRTSINNIDRVVSGGTSKLSTIQFKNFLDKIQADAASEFGIRLPNPDDQSWEAFKEEYSKYT